MKPLLLFGCLLLAGTAAHAQFSLLPYAGFEHSRNTLNYDNGLSAASINGNLKAGLKLDYRLKGGHNPFLNLGTSPAPVSFHFDNNGALDNAYEAVKGKLQFRMEAGYQYNSKPIQLGKKSPALNRPAPEVTDVNTTQRKSCGSTTYRSHCGERKSFTKAAPVDRSLNMRLQPSLALAYVPAAEQSVKQTSNGFDYTLGNWKTAVVPAMGFEFAKGARRLFTLAVFYTRPLGQNDESVKSLSEGKSYVTNLQPKTSGWGLTLGVPIGFAKTKTVKAVKANTEKRACTKTYYRRCMQMQ